MATLNFSKALKSGGLKVDKKKGTSTALPKIGSGGTTPVNINKAKASGGLTTGLVSGGKPYVAPKIGSGGTVPFNPSSLNSKGLTVTKKSGGGGGSKGSVLGASSFNDSALSIGEFGSTSSPQRFSAGSVSGTSNLGSGVNSLPTSNVINAPNILNNTNQKITFPEPVVGDYSMDIPTPIEQQKIDLEAEQKASEDDYLKKLMDDFNDRETASEIDAKLQKQLGIKQKQQLVADLTGQLNGIVAKGQAQQLAQVGQGRGIPEAIIGGIQAQIGRETAIAALPIQAQLSAAQGNLEMANDSLDRLFKIYSEEAENDFNFRKEMRTKVYEFASAKQKKKLEALDKKEERAYQEGLLNKKASEDMIKNAFAQQAPMSVTNKALEILKSGGNQTEIAKALGVYAGDVLERQLKLAQIDAARASAAKTREEAKAKTTQSSAAQNVVDVARELLNNKDLGAITGTLDQLTGGIFGDQAKLAKNKWNQLKGMLSLENRQQLKGSGAISDFEFRILGQASSALGRNLSDATFKTELQNLINNLSTGGTSNSTSSGNTYILKQPNGQINNNQGVTPSGIGFTIKP